MLLPSFLLTLGSRHSLRRRLVLIRSECEANGMNADPIGLLSLFRRKSNRAAVQNGNGTLSAEPASVYDDDHLQSPKMYLIPTKSLSSTSAPKKNPVSNLPPTQPVVEDPPASLSTRKRWSRKKNVPAGSKPSTMAAPQEQATANNTVPSRTEVRKDPCSIQFEGRPLH